MQPSTTVPVPAPHTAPVTRPPRAWALTGAAGGLTGLAGLFACAELTAPAEGLLGDNAALAATLAGRGGYVWAYQVVCAVTALCLAVFAAGLRRSLAAHVPAASLLPGLAAAGVGAVAVLVLVGGGIATELFWALDAGADPDAIVAQLAVYDTLAWVWAGGGLAAGAVAVAGFRHGAVGRWFAGTSAALAALVGATQLYPVQYIALVPAGLWVILAGVVFAARPRTN
ncbi:hypothetical protein [Spirilliplanes yamanashiensis]|uniref:DUF4386 family protein n=1 Tax=Spirilliplanes yamanashiensis TaxID=42233 RepID=A0A8J3Y9M4_9ACTN|nr:hypothetical protein [Spirilliplanes yamanashiensis]MDP9817633.1 hypothetical protein [Spirilliplanes yamanashiensis]GIJ04443.1 hypothetical protein Sya03_37950 [Spirilliplanes yamanashiensis]